MQPTEATTMSYYYSCFDKSIQTIKAKSCISHKKIIKRYSISYQSGNNMTNFSINLLFRSILLLFFLGFFSLVHIHCDEHSHRYEKGEEVVLWMNTVGPYVNHQETYNYFSLPFCRGSKQDISHYHENIAEAIQGVELEISGIDIQFLVDVSEPKVICSTLLDQEKSEKFKYALRNYYSYQMYLDELPIEGLIGEFDHNKSEQPYSLYTHKEFIIGYNGNQIIYADVRQTPPFHNLKPNTAIDFTYTVVWKPSNISFNDRFNKYLDPTVFKPRIHWFSIFNSFMLVFFLIGLVSMILVRTLHRDYARYQRDEFADIERDLGEEYGWKQVHSDVFRIPRYPLLLSVCVGTGYHIAVATFCVIIFTIIGDLYLERGSILSTGIYTYALTSIINGFYGGSLYAQMHGKHWIKQCLVSAAFFPSLACGTAFFINFIALYYHASRAIPFLTMLSIVAICLFIILPLTLVGSIVGRNTCGHANYPCRVSSVPRPIPEKKWYMRQKSIVLIGGLLPFGSMSIEMYFIFTSFWTFRIYYVYGFMLLVFLIAMAVSACVTIVCTYMLLNAEDYRW